MHIIGQFLENYLYHEHLLSISCMLLVFFLKIVTFFMNINY